MKQWVKGVLGHLGYEIRRKPTQPMIHTDTSVPRGTMKAGLQWLQAHQIPITTVLDVGASDGSWSQKCMAAYPQATYLLFEPQPVHSEALDAFVAATSQTVIPVKKAVGDRQGTTFFDASSPFGGALAKTSDGHTIEVEVITLDQAIAQLQVPGPYLLKLDTHGFEKAILAGADQTLQQCEALVIEAYNYSITEDTLLFWQLCQFLHERGFRPVDLVDVLHRPYDHSLWQMDLVFIKSSWPGFDYTAYRHKGSRFKAGQWGAERPTVPSNPSRLTL